MRQLVKEKENSEFKPFKLRLKIDLVSYPVRAEGLGKYDNRIKVLGYRKYYLVSLTGRWDWTNLILLWSIFQSNASPTVPFVNYIFGIYKPNVSIAFFFFFTIAHIAIFYVVFSINGS